jgi:very-short-patch-repair endonuclease
MRFSQTRSELLASGVDPNTVRSRVRRGHYNRLAHGVYDANRATSIDEQWRRELELLLHRGGDDSAVSGVAAALVHGLDGYDLRFFRERPVTAISSMSGHVRDRRVMRSRVLTEHEMVDVEGLRVLSPVATVAWLGAYANVDAVELALESVLRGPDPRRPDVWNQNAMAALVQLSQQKRVPGRSELRLVLRRRGDVLPTASAAETQLALGLRAARVPLSRQVRVCVLDRRRASVGTFWLDFANVSTLLAVEVDGRIAHGTSTQIDRDYRRDNLLNSVFTIVRYSASTVRKERPAVVADIARRIADSPKDRSLPDGWSARAVPGGIELRSSRHLAA